jgi:ferredoxin-type protein NapG
MPDESRFNRRNFFREGLRELLKPLSRAVEPMQKALEQFESIAGETGKTAAASSESKRGSSSAPNVWLRPPGALYPDKEFRDTCSRCRKCVEVCPAQCIQIDPTGRRGNGAPFISPEEMPCVVCDGLKCMHVCPTGALTPIPLAEINMGTALWNETLCVRSKVDPSTGSGQGCTVCIDTCPIGEVAIELREGKVHVIDDGCTGCGVCQQRCPTEPKSIIVLTREICEGRAV